MSGKREMFHKDITKKSFDYIVLGAGTAGGVIAKELTDDMKTSVLVLEEGTNKMRDFSNPSGGVALTLSSDNKYSFNILSKLEQTIGRQVLLSGGRVIGGSSTHNAMLAVRGSRELYDEWASISGSRVGVITMFAICLKRMKHIQEIHNNQMNVEKMVLFLLDSK